VERGYEQGVRLGPIDQLMRYFTGDSACLPCIWLQNCTDEFVSIDARGHVAQCDCWITSYPDYWFRNIFDDISFTELMQQSKARQHASGYFLHSNPSTMPTPAAISNDCRGLARI